MGHVNENAYLFAFLSTENCMSKKIARTIINIWKRFWSLSEIVKGKDMPMKGKINSLCSAYCTIGTA